MLGSYPAHSFFLVYYNLSDKQHSATAQSVLFQSCMEGAVLDSLQTILFESELPTNCSALPSHPLMALYNPKTLVTPQSLDNIGLKIDAPYQDADGFSDIVALV